MSIKSSISSMMVAGTFLSLSATAFAQTVDRCTKDDQLGLSDAIGRNAWSRNCGYITSNTETLLNAEGLYVVYSNACAAYPYGGVACTKYAPTSAAYSCISGLNKVGTCYAGCYTPTQEIAFDEQYTPIADAYTKGATTVTALEEGSTPEHMTFREQPIRTFVVGETEEPIFLLETLNGRSIEVTAEHPMVNILGDIVKARTLKPGDLLLGDEGGALELASVSTFLFTGKVWNVQPTSHVKAENILKAQGFLSGSVRFQNEWAEEIYRLWQRDDLDVSKL